MPYISKVATGELPKISVFGDDYDTPDGTGVRDYIHVEDLARGHVLSLARLFESGEGHLVNLGTGRGYSVLEVIAAYKRASNPGSPPTRSRRDGRATCPSTSRPPGKAADVLGFRTEKTLDEMCASSWAWISGPHSGGNRLMAGKTALVTGSSGFIGYHLCRRLLSDGWEVIGIDCLSDYYDVSLKERRQSGLMQSAGFRTVTERIETPGVMHELMEQHRPDALIHLAAQAGVRYSIDHPESYVEANLIGTFRVLEAMRAFPPRHSLLASTSSVYGANTEMPYAETAKADTQMSFYAATKKATEAMAHSYAHLYDLPTTMFRFFTVYGPWGRPDMAP